MQDRPNNIAAPTPCPTPPPPPPSATKSKFVPAPPVCICSLHCPIHNKRVRSDSIPSLLTVESGAGSDSSIVDELADALSYVDVDTNSQESSRITIDDVLQPREVKESDDVTFSDELMAKSAFYVVTHGRSTGVFDDWQVHFLSLRMGPITYLIGRHTADECVTSFSANCHCRCNTAEAAWSRWATACIAGRVKNKLHPDSLFDKVVTLQELQDRVDSANVADFVASSAQATARAQAAATALPSSSAGSSTVAPLSNNHTAVAWVVIRGRFPSVCYNREDFNDARATGPGGWAFPCSSVTEAEAQYLQYQSKVKVID